MDDKLKTFQTTEMLPFNAALNLISGKWKMNILYALSRLGKLRYGQIKNLLENITPHVLATKLKELEAEGLIKRVVYPEVPPKVVYSITTNGESLLPILKQLCDWGKINCTEKE